MNRAAFTTWIQEQKGKPYVWGSKGQLFTLSGSVQVECFDCSGLVTRGLIEAGFPKACPWCRLDLCGYHNAQRLFDELAPIKAASLRPGDLMFFGAGPSRISHVMVWLDAERCFGASGGNRESADPVVSLRLGHKVKSQPVTYRADLIGYRALPL